MSFDDRRLGESNWRPRWVSTAAAAVFALAVTIGLAAGTDAAEPAVVGLVSGLCLGAAVWSIAVTERRVATILAGILATLSGLAVLGAVLVAAVVQVGWPPTPPFEFLALAPFVLALAGFLSGFGAPTAVWGITPSGEAGTAVLRLLVVVSVPAVALVAVFFAPPIDPAIDAIRSGLDLALARGPASEPILVDGIPIPRFGGLFALTAIAALTLEIALGRLPLAELAGDHSRGTIDDAVGRLRGWLRIVAAFATVFAIAGVVAQPVTPELYARVPSDFVAVGIELTLSTTIRWALLSVAVVSLPAIVVSRLVRAVASEQFRPNTRLLVPLAVGGLFVAAAVGTHASVEVIALDRAGSAEGRELLRTVFTEIGSLAITLGVVVLGLSVSMALLLFVRLAGAFRFLGATMGVQSLSAGVLIAAVGAAIAEVSAPFVIAGVAASLFVWDVGEFADTLAREIGRRGDALGSELVHFVGAAVLAIGSVGVAIAATRATEFIPSASPALSLLTTVAVVVGTLFSFLVAR